MTDPSAFATLADQRVTRALVSMPGSGIATAEVQLATAIALAGRVTLTIGDLAFSGSVYRGGPVHGASAFVLEAGAGGWRKAVPARSYRNDAGVKLSTLAADLATAVGETLAAVPELRLGGSYVRPAGPASRALYDLLGTGWYVGLDGVTHLEAPSGDDVTAEYQVTDYDPSTRTATLACETPAAIVPGVRLVAGLPEPMRVRAVRLVFGGALRIHVEGTAS